MHYKELFLLAEGQSTLNLFFCWWIIHLNKKWQPLHHANKKWIHSLIELIHFLLLQNSAWPILIRLGTNFSWLKGIQVDSNKVDTPSPRGDNSKRVKKYWNSKKKKKIFSWTSQLISIKFGTHHPWGRGNKVCWNKGQVLFKEEITTKMCPYWTAQFLLRVPSAPKKYEF
jgi:hypothetical protein